MIGGSRFADRFAYARLVQPVETRAEKDRAFGKAVGVGSSSIVAYRDADDPPPVVRVLAIAKRCQLDPGWLAFGRESAAPEPDGFAAWLQNKRTGPAAERPIKVMPASALEPVPHPKKRVARKRRAR